MAWTRGSAMVSGVVAVGGLVAAGAAGPLTPPSGVPQSTGPTMLEVEPRTSIASLPFVITEPGSYYLMGDLEGKSGIQIQASGVTLDLNGFTLRGVDASTPGVTVQAGVTNTTIQNGLIEGWAGDGVNAPNADTGLIAAVTAAGNAGDGFDLGDNWVVVNALATDNGGSGIGGSNNGVASDSAAENNADSGVVFGDGATISNVSSDNNGLSNVTVGIGSTITNSSASGRAGTGFLLGEGSSISGSVASGATTNFDATAGSIQVAQCTSTAGGTGFALGASSSITGSLATRAESVGILLASLVTVQGNTVSQCNIGIDSFGVSSYIEGNTATANNVGIRMGGSGSLAVGNVAGGNNTPFQFEQGNAWGSILGIGGDGAFSVSDTFANLAY